MAVNAKAIKQRIKSVTNTQKMTRAMEMVSAAKMRKATEAALNTRLYATLAHELMTKLSTLEDPNYPLLELRPIEDVLVVLVSSNRGLCGSYNSNVFKKTRQVLLNDDLVGMHRINSEGVTLPPKRENPNIHIVGIGRKSAQFAKTYGYELDAVFDELSETPSYEEILPIAEFAIAGYTEKKYDRVMVAYTNFVSTLSQEVKIRQLMPISPKDLTKMIDETGALDSTSAEFEIPELGGADLPLTTYTFEPSSESVLDYVLPKLVEIQLFQAMLESSASEHSSRMIAMKNASESAGDMVKDLTLTYNKARQAAITQEIAEIVGGAAALE